MRPKNWRNLLINPLCMQCNLQICKKSHFVSFVFSGKPKIFRVPSLKRPQFDSFLHIFKLIDSTFGIAFSHFTQGLILVSTLFNIFLVDSVHGSFSRLNCSVRELILKHEKNYA